MDREIDFQKLIFDYVEQVKELLSPDIWKNILLDCSKNEILTLWLIYRKHEVNMTMIADYINVPLNTATGIVGRLEKRGFVVRKRSTQDKRVVTIQLNEQGTALIEDLIKEITFYGTKLMQRISTEEIKALLHIMNELKMVLAEGRRQDKKAKKVKKIVIE